ncbi:MAG TPA: SDR family oxidoreductase [Blastocatellia bacterium]|jgi:NAD(P)-dependent dehydrogenase (short-subunit alcohol dehydrogenase family)|nr:SDR family oxidoreductase [Blastocatellia bacterium]
MENLKGKRVIITGGAGGIGLVAARVFAESGAQVVIADINEGALAQAIKELQGRIKGLVVDVTDEGSVIKAFRQMDDQLGGIDVLISNAGISIRKKFLESTFEDWRSVISVNLDGMYLCSREAARLMARDRSGVILMTASTNGMVGYPYYASYNASKAGVISLTKSLAIELAPHVRVNAICPGYVLTQMQEREYTASMLEEVNRKIPLKRHASPLEIAQLFAFLASDKAEYISGQTITIDGGELAGGLASAGVPDER